MHVNVCLVTHMKHEHGGWLACDFDLSVCRWRDMPKHTTDVPAGSKPFCSHWYKDGDLLRDQKRDGEGGLLHERNGKTLVGKDGLVLQARGGAPPPPG